MNSQRRRRCLWEFEGHLYTHRWLEPNVTFLKGALNVPGVTEVLGRAVDRLIGHSEYGLAASIREDPSLLADTLQVRCAELPRLLEAIQEPGRPCMVIIPIAFVCTLGLVSLVSVP